MAVRKTSQQRYSLTYFPCLVFCSLYDGKPRRFWEFQLRAGAPVSRSLIQKKAILLQGSPFSKGSGLIQVNLERKPGVEVDLPIGTAIAAAATEPAEPARYTGGLSETRGRHIANRRSEVYVVQNILNV